MKETTDIEPIGFIEAILEFQSSKKTEFGLRKSNLVTKKRKAQQSPVKHVTNIQKQTSLSEQINKAKKKIGKLVTIAKTTKQRNSLKQIID